jgi:hypothetical protein
MRLFSKKKVKQKVPKFPANAESNKELKDIEENNPFIDVPEEANNQKIPIITPPTNQNSNNSFTEEPVQTIPEIPSINNQEDSFIQEPVKEESPKIPDMPIKVESKEVKDYKLKEAIKAEIPKKTEFDAKKVNEDIKYLDEILDKNLNLNSDEIKDIVKPKKSKPIEVLIAPEKEITKTKIKPEIRKSLEKHDEIINIDLGEEEEIKPVIFNKEVNVKEIKKEQIKIEKPLPVGNSELPDFDQHKPSISQKTREMIEDFKSRKKVTGDLFVKATSYREVLRTNLTLKEDVTNCEEKLKKVELTIESQEKYKEKLKDGLEFIQDNMMLIEEKLFDKNQYVR